MATPPPAPERLPPPPAELATLIVGWPVERGVGGTLEAFQPGLVILGVELDGGRLDAAGQPSMAVLACLCDAALGSSVVSTLQAPTGASTLEMRLDRAAPLGPGARQLRVEGRAGHPNRHGALGRVTVTDDTGAVVAHAIGTMAIARRPPSPGVWVPGSDASAPGGPDPARPRFDPVGLDRSPAWDGPDPAVATITLDGSVANPFLQVHGGVLMTLAERAGRRLHPPEASLLTITMGYLRPAMVAGGVLTARSTVVHMGRRYSTVRTELVGPDGKVAAEATGIAAAATPAG